MPSTYVFDGRGQLRRVFRGEVSEGQLSPLLASFEAEAVFEADLLMLARRADRRRDAATAIHYYERLLALRPDDLTVLHAKANAHDRLGQHEAATGLLERAIRLDRTYAAAHFDLALAHMRAKQPKRAATGFQTYLDLGGDSPRAHLYLAVTAADSGQLDLAAQAAERAVEASSDALEPWLIKARVHRARGEVKLARHTYLRVLAVDPTHAVATADLAALPTE